MCVYCHSPEEAGRYLETYKVYENKPPDALLGQSEGDYLSKVVLNFCSLLYSSLVFFGNNIIIILLHILDNIVSLIAHRLSDYSEGYQQD